MTEENGNSSLEDDENVSDEVIQINNDENVKNARIHFKEIPKIRSTVVITTENSDVKEKVIKVGKAQGKN